MNNISIKVKSFLQELKDKPDPTEEERVQALELIAETLREKNMLLVHKREEIEALSKKIHLRKNRLEQIRDRLELAIKCGIANDTIH